MTVGGGDWRHASSSGRSPGPPKPRRDGDHGLPGWAGVVVRVGPRRRKCRDDQEAGRCEAIVRLFCNPGRYIYLPGLPNSLTISGTHVSLAFRLVGTEVFAIVRGCIYTSPHTTAAGFTRFRDPNGQNNQMGDRKSTRLNSSHVSEYAL